jgi:hypothetical protein
MFEAIRKFIGRALRCYFRSECQGEVSRRTPKNPERA